ncbi:hypothetical protein V7150_25555 [Neobacillus drentensis]
MTFGFRGFGRRDLFFRNGFRRRRFFPIEIEIEIERRRRFGFGRRGF